MVSIFSAFSKSICSLLARNTLQKYSITGTFHNAFLAVDNPHVFIVLAFALPPPPLTFFFNKERLTHTGCFLQVFFFDRALRMHCEHGILVG